MGICCSAKQIVSDEIYSAIDKNENYEDIFLSLNPDDFNIRKLKVKKYS